jgi:hypothetical protein
MLGSTLPHALLVDDLVKMEQLSHCNKRAYFRTLPVISVVSKEYNYSCLINIFLSKQRTFVDEKTSKRSGTAVVSSTKVQVRTGV